MLVFQHFEAQQITATALAQVFLYYFFVCCILVFWYSGVLVFQHFEAQHTKATSLALVLVV